jgi:hypothetical protein
MSFDVASYDKCTVWQLWFVVVLSACTKARSRPPVARASLDDRNVQMTAFPCSPLSARLEDVHGYVPTAQLDAVPEARYVVGTLLRVREPPISRTSERDVALYRYAELYGRRDVAIRLEVKADECKAIASVRREWPACELRQASTILMKAECTAIADCLTRTRFKEQPANSLLPAVVEDSDGGIMMNMNEIDFFWWIERRENGDHHAVLRNDARSKADGAGLPACRAMWWKLYQRRFEQPISGTSGAEHWVP